MDNCSPIGVFDSGVGGLTVVKEIIRLMPEENILYFGDCKRAPYGPRAETEIIGFMREILAFLTRHDIKMAVIACNTMTALGLETARVEFAVPIVGVNSGARSALKYGDTVGVLATQATVNSGKHANALKLYNPKARAVIRECPLYVPLIEQEKLTGNEIERATEEYVRPLLKAGVCSVILGCTHYPLVSQVINKWLGGSIAIIDPAAETAEDARDIMEVYGNRNKGSESAGKIKLCFSADLSKAARFADLILPNHSVEIELVRL